MNKKTRPMHMLSKEDSFQTKKGHYIMIKGPIQEDITLINIYTLNIGAPTYIKQL
mgnify:CR=1 FL=1